MDGHIFISHTTADDAFVKALRIKLALHGLDAWVDSRNLRGGDKLEAEIEQAIREASYVIAVLSPATVNSPWVRKEIRFAEDHEHAVIPLLLPGIEPSALGAWFDEAPVAEKIETDVGKLDEALPHILAALGQRAPDHDLAKEQEVGNKPVAELLLALSRPTLTQDKDGKEQLSAEAELKFIPADSPIEPGVISNPFRFIAPIGQIEQDEIRWYLEEYFRWPVGLFHERAEHTESQLAKWGQVLFAASLDQDECKVPLQAWQEVRDEVERRFSVQVDVKTIERGKEAKQQAKEAASRLQNLPWELLHDDTYLSDGANPVRIRRRLPNRKHLKPQVTVLPIRILLLSPRPEEEGVSYIDHRVSARPLVQAVESLGDLVALTVLSPPTLAALEKELHRARKAETPYEVLHFDGHGVYDKRHGLGALCFENPNDVDKLEARRNELVHANTLAKLLKDFRIPLVFLEACQTAQTEENPNASVAASLLEEGVTSVVAMSHSVLVKTAQRFVTEFYQALAEGQRVGTAMLAGQKTLMHHTERGQIPGAGALHLQDWFVPILYQEQHDPQLFARIPSKTAQKMQAQQRQARLGRLPDEPEHSFVGRSRELLKAERLLEQQPYAVVRGQGGAGKTTLAVELARWLVRSGRFDRCAFVSVEEYTHDRAVVEVLIQQLVNPKHNLAAEYAGEVDNALQAIQRELENARSLIVVDNMESLLADNANKQAVLAILAKLPEATLLFTSREPLPKPFHHKAREIELGALSLKDAKALVMQVMSTEGLHLKHDDMGNTPEEVNALVGSVGCHARALVLLARALAQRGVTATTDNVREIMQELEQRHPGQRELSLFASVELSLRRLSPEVREQIGGLAVFEDGGRAEDFAGVLGSDKEVAMFQMAHLLGQLKGSEELEGVPQELLQLMAEDEVKQMFAAGGHVAQAVHELIEVGLAQAIGEYGYIRLDPALPAYLNLALNTEQREGYRQRWRDVMGQLVDFLYQQQFQDAKLAAQLSQLELPNLMAYLQAQVAGWQAGALAAETVAAPVRRVEQLLANLNQAQALAQVVAWRQQLAQGLEEWSSARFEHERMTIERLLQQGDGQGAFKAAQALLQQCQQAGEQAYAGADYDLAMATKLLGQVLKTGGAAAQALPTLQDAQQRFEALGEDGARMASVTLTEQGDCLRALGNLEAAAAAYEENIQRAEKLNDTRQVATGKVQLATTRMLQKRYAEALQGYRQARALFEQLNEPGSVATIWHQMGMTYQAAGNFEQAEQAYRQSMSINSQQGNQAGEAASLNELGNLYDAWKRPEQAVGFYRQAVDIAVKMGDLRKEGIRRNNIAATLIKLQRYDDARPELERAIACKQGLGHAGTVWNAWNILYDLEQASGHPAAARDARQKALAAYLAYRRDGGENHSGIGRLALAVTAAIKQGETEEMGQLIGQLLETPEMAENKNFLHKLQAILAGERDLSLAEDENLDYDDAAELQLLLETLAEGEAESA